MGFLHPSKFGLKDRQPTMGSDCSALRMVTYDVLRGNVPFAMPAKVVVMVATRKGQEERRFHKRSESLLGNSVRKPGQASGLCSSA